MKKPNKILSVLLSAMIAFSGVIIAANASSTPSGWALKDVNEAIDKGLVPSSLCDKYTDAITRKEFCALGVKLYESKNGAVSGYEAVKFTDTSDVDVLKMASVGIVNGVGDNKFAPDDKITREQAAIILVNLSEKLGRVISDNEPDFKDKNSISSWAKAAVGKAQSAGIMNGTDVGFEPKGKYSREQSIITILRIYKNSSDDGNVGSEAKNMMDCSSMASRSVNGLTIDFQNDGGIHIYGKAEKNANVDVTELTDWGMRNGEQYTFIVRGNITSGNIRPGLYAKKNNSEGTYVAELPKSLKSNVKITSVVVKKDDYYKKQSIRFYAYGGTEMDCVIYPELVKGEVIIDEEAENLQHISLNGQSSNFRICIASDIHTGENGTTLENTGFTSDERIQLFIDSVNAEHAKKPYDALILTGDVAANDLKQLKDWATKYRPQLDMPVYITKGNHDPFTDKEFYDTTGSYPQYAFDIGPFHFIMMDMFENIKDYAYSSKMYSPLSDSDWEFIDKEVEAANGRPVIIIGHYFDKNIETKLMERIQEDDRIAGVIFGHSHTWSNEATSKYFRLITNSFCDTTHAWPTDITKYPNYLWGFRELEIVDGKLITRHIQPAHFYPYYKNDFPDGYPYTVSEKAIAVVK